MPAKVFNGSPPIAAGDAAASDGPIGRRAENRNHRRTQQRNTETDAESDQQEPQQGGL